MFPVHHKSPERTRSEYSDRIANSTGDIRVEPLAKHHADQLVSLTVGVAAAMLLGLGVFQVIATLI